MFKDDSEKLLAGIVLGGLIGVGLRCLRRYDRVPVPWYQAMPWQYHALCTVCSIVFAIACPPPLRWFGIAWATVSLPVTVWKLSKQRVQFSLRSMLLATLLVAMLLSAGYYLTLTAVLAFVTTIATEWIKLEECRRLSLLPPQEPGEETDPQ